ncbi:DUF4328 domain-containing protein [Nonomuraea sp. NPDC050310]|uniref:DUF4328 domain-containing protein n=1 Tax=unclassified Nonomuraea TaxID=2593643 RepID=UPI0033ED4974
MRFITRAVYVALAAHIASLTALVVFEELRGHSLVTQLASIDHPDSTAAQAVVGAVTVFAVLIMLVVGTLAVAAVAYLTWLVRVRQAHDRAASPAPVLLGWLIPGVALVAPVVLVDDVWKNSRPPFDQRPRWLFLLGAWWLSWLAAVASLIIRLGDDSAGTLTGIGVRELALAAFAAVLCAATVREIERIQTVAARARRALPGSLSHV